MKKITAVKKSIITAVCIALSVVLPQAFHAIPNAGAVYSPMHIPVLLCGLICGGPCEGSDLLGRGVFHGGLGGRLLCHGSAGHRDPARASAQHRFCPDEGRADPRAVSEEMIG